LSQHLFAGDEAVSFFASSSDSGIRLVSSQQAAAQQPAASFPPAMAKNPRGKPADRVASTPRASANHHRSILSPHLM